MWIYLADVAAAATLNVGTAQPYATIGAAIGAASSGDDIVVDPGIWTESLDLDGKNLTIRSAGGASVTTIAPPAGQFAFRYNGGESGTLQGFTITPTDNRAIEIVGGGPTLRDLVIDGSGRSTFNGGAIRIEGATVGIEGVRIIDSVGQRGGAIYAVSSDIDIDELTIENASGGYGGAIYLVEATLTGNDLAIEAPQASYSGVGLYLDQGSRVNVDELSITDAAGTWSHGAGAYLRNGSVLVANGGRISRGRATQALLGYDGGGVWLDETSALTLRHFELVGNEARYGGAISTSGGSVVLADVSFDGNHALLDGGALIASTQATVTVSDSTFDGNTGIEGGAVRLSSGASLTDENSVWSTNIASANGGAISADDAALISLTGTLGFSNEAFGAGGAIWVGGTTGGLTGVDVFLTDNRAVAGDGGAIGVGSGTALVLTGGAFERNRADAGYGGAISVSSVFGPADVRLVEVELSENTADRSGGALLVDGIDDLVLTDAILTRNVAGADGGGWLVDGAHHVEVVRTLVHDNLAIGRGGGGIEQGTATPALYANVTFTENTAARGGGLALRNAAEAVVTNVTFAGNSAQFFGGHLHVEGGTVRLVNTILALASDGGGVWGDATAGAGSDVFYGITFANAGGSWIGSFNDPIGSGNLTGDPLFRAFSIDGNEGNDDLRLGLGSPSIDFGDPSLADVDGSRSDMGAWGGPNGFRIDADADGIYVHADCDDRDPTVSPVAIEIPYDGIDQDCDGIDPTDLDGDGYDGGPDGPDCDDADTAVNPLATEIWYDGFDQNCDEHSDFDADFDEHDAVTFGGLDCDDTDPEVGPSNPEIWYDGFDQDCSGGSDYDRDADGQDSDVYGGTDCRDGNAQIFAGAPEVCDHQDNNCNGVADDEPVDPTTYWADTDDDGYGDANNWDTACWGGPGLSDNALDCDDTEAGVHPGVSEIWYDGVDQNCDGRDDDQDLDGFVRADECDDLRADAYPGAPELLNGLDDDCDGFPETADRDDDGLIDWDEWQLETDYLNPDTDGDGLLDGAEIPDAANPADTDSDGRIDALDEDDDNDRIPTATEISVDSDGDGAADFDVDRDGTPNHLDLDTDGDSFDDIDEGVLDRDADEVADFADYTGLFAGGGCTGGCSNTGTSAGWLVLLLPLILRRRSLAVAALLAAPALAKAQAEEGLDAHGFDLFGTTADPRGGNRLTEGGQSETGLVMGLVVDQANRPIIEELPGGPDPLIEHLTTANVVLSLTPLDQIRIEAVMPVHVLGMGTAGNFSTTGDLRFGAQVGLVRRNRAVPGVSLLGSAWIPTGTEGRYVGAPDVAAGGGLALSERIGRFGWTLNGGVRIAPERERRGQVTGPGPWGGFGMHYAPREDLALVAELTVDGITGWSDFEALPIEAMGGIRGRGQAGRFWTLSAGAGLTDAVGATAWRIALGGGFGPKQEEVVFVEAPPPVVEAPPEPEPVAVVPPPAPPPLAALVDDRIVLGEQVFFEEAKAVILPESDDVLDAVRQVLVDHPEIQYILIEGHTNHNGTAEYNYVLSRDRAEAVRTWLAQHGIDRKRLLADGFGFDRPLLPPSAPNAYEVNRRVEFVVVRPDETP